MSLPGTSAAVSKTDRAPTNSTAGVFARREDACAGPPRCTARRREHGTCLSDQAGAGVATESAASARGSCSRRRCSSIRRSRPPCCSVAAARCLRRSTDTASELRSPSFHDELDLVRGTDVEPSLPSICDETDLAVADKVELRPPLSA